MSAPDAIISRVVSILSASEMPSIGDAISADAPPDSRMTSASPECTPCATAIARLPAASLRASGNGWLDSIHSTLRRQLGMRVRADRDRLRGSPGAAARANAAAIAAAALPTATTCSGRPVSTSATSGSASARAITRSRADRVDAGADDAIEIVLECGNGNRQ